MSSTLLRGLRLLETVDFYGPLSISALARQLGIDKATASRIVSSCEPDGWLVRDGDGVRIGPRAAMLGQDAPAGHALRIADPLMHAVSGVTGMLAQASGLVGKYAVILSSESPVGDRIPYGLTTRFPLWLTAAAKVVASQLPPKALSAALVPDPLPGPEELLETVAPRSVLEAFMASLGIDGVAETDEPGPSTLVSTRTELLAQLDVIRRDGVFRDGGEISQQVSCIAVPWSRAGLPAAMAVIGLRSAVDEQAPLIERALRAAARPGATRESIVAAAAAR